MVTIPKSQVFLNFIFSLTFVGKDHIPFYVRIT